MSLGLLILAVCLGVTVTLNISLETKHSYSGERFTGHVLFPPSLLNRPYRYSRLWRMCEHESKPDMTAAKHMTLVHFNFRH